MKQLPPAPSNTSIAQRLPDLPRWVEARALLLWEPCEIFGFQVEPELSLVVREPDSGFVVIVGRPSEVAIQAAIQGSQVRSEAVAPLELALQLTELLPEWSFSRILVHTLPDQRRLPETPGSAVGFLDPARLDQLPIDADLKQEIEYRADQSVIAAAFVDTQPVSFCYAGAITELWWDVSIDTLPEHRRKGYAGLCAAYMIRHMHTQGRQPVWQAVDDNPASWRLAQKLGFVQVDQLALLEPPSL